MLAERLIGQPVAARQLDRALADGAVHHALRFYGPSGVGKRLAATLFAQGLLCDRAPGGAQPPCGVCNSCRQLALGRHPDLHWVEPQGASIGIEQVRGLKLEVALKPHSGALKFVVIDPADALTIQAQNSLLKLLEEPPGTAVIVLIEHGSTGPNQRAVGLLPTIRSRCMSIRFTRLPTEAVQARARAQGADEVTARLCSALAQGSFGRLDTLLSLDVPGVRAQVLDDALRIKRLGRAAAMSVAARMANAPELWLQLEVWTLWLRDLLVWPREALVVNGDLAEQIAAGQAAESPAHLARRLGYVAQARRQLAQNVNTRIVLDALLANLCAEAVR